MPAGKGKCFKQDVKMTITNIINEINACIESDEYIDASNKIKESYYEEGEKLLKYIKDKAKELGFFTQITETGLYFVPVIDGKKISEQNYDDLSMEEQENILNNLNIIEEESENIMKKVKDNKKIADERAKEYKDSTAIKIVYKHFDNIIKQYYDNNKILEYLNILKEDITTKINELIKKEECADNIKNLISTISKEEQIYPNKYEVNLIVDNSSLIGAPVIYSGNPNFNNLVGRVEFENELGNLTTDFTKIQLGLLHKANGGYLILHVNDLINNLYVWEYLKKALLNGKIELENMREKLGGLPIRSVNPEPIPLNLKVVLIGNQYLYQLLYQYDEDFKKLFKIHVQLDYEMELNKKYIDEYNVYINNYIKNKKLLPIKQSARIRLLYYASRLAGNKNKLSTKIGYVEDVLVEADYWARIEKEQVIYEYHVKKALLEKDKRTNFIKNKIYEMITSNKIKVELQGEKIGQINGLAVLNYGECEFGKPIRITATTYLGQSGMVNIEKESGLSGAIHNKGVNILTGYLGEKYAQEFPLTFSCRLCFEQNYNGIDGDSATSAELYSILSSLSEIPIKQNFAVTGSVDQKGNIQPVGGIIEKVEGFYKICKIKGFDGKQSVIIPKDNIDELVLNDEILEDIRQEKFFIYAIEHVEEGIEIITGETIKNIDEKITNKLLKYYQNSIRKIKDEK